MKGNLYANPTFIRRNIRQPTVISIRPLVAYDQNRIYFNGLSMKWQAKDIVNCTFSSHYRVLLVLTDDYKIYVFTEQLQLITHLNNWEPKYIVGFELLEELGMMLLIGTEQVEVMKVNVVSNVKRTKFLSSMKFAMKKEQHLKVQNCHKLKWNKGYGYIKQEDILYLWSLQDIHFYSLQKLTIRTKIPNITKKQLPITTVFFSNYYKYTVVGLLNGDIKVWRLPISPLYSHKQVLIHNFGHHSREVQQIIEGQDYKTIITYGLDLNVCFLSLQTFQMLRSFNFVGEYTKLFLYNNLFAYAIKDSYLGQLNFGKNIQFITDLTGVPIFHDYSHHKQNRLQLTISSNLGIELNLTQITDLKEVNKMEIGHIYPPLKSKSITQIVSCPYMLNTHFILVEDGDIFRAKLQTTMGKIDQHFVVSKIHDSQKHPLNQQANFISFFRIIPPQIDTQIIEKTIDKTFKSAREQKRNLKSELKLLTIGCSRGSIIFVSLDRVQRIYARISYHREKIIHVQQITNEDKGFDWLTSVCEEKYMKIVNFQGNRANCLFTFFCGEVYRNMYSFQDSLALIFCKGVFDIVKCVSPQLQPSIILNRQSINHEQEIIAISYQRQSKMILTGALDNRIKIWSICKILLYEIIIDENLSYCVWADRMSIVMVQSQKLCCLRDIPLSFKKGELENLNAQFQANFLAQDQIPLGKYFEQMIIRNKQKLFKVRAIKKHQSLHDSPAVTKGQDRNRQLTSPGRSEQKMNKSAIIGLKTPTRQKKLFVIKTQESAEDKNRQESDLQAMRKHLQELSSLKKVTNESLLPKLKPKNEDIFVSFMREKLLNKKLLTRRDITLNRIIMKNIIKDHLGGQREIIKNFKLE